MRELPSVVVLETNIQWPRQVLVKDIRKKCTVTVSVTGNGDYMVCTSPCVYLDDYSARVRASSFKHSCACCEQ